MAEQTRWNKVERGLFRARLVGPTDRGPVHINLLRFDRGRFRFRVVDVRAENRTGGPFEEYVAATGAVAAISGGFFLYSETGIEEPAKRFDPVGLLVGDGRVLSPPVYSRPAFVQDGDGHVHIRRIGLKGVAVCWPDHVRVHIGGINNRGRKELVPVAFNRAFHPAAPTHKGLSLTFVGTTLVDVSENVSAPIPVGGFVVTLPPHPEWNDLIEQVPLHGTVDYLLPAIHGMALLKDGVAGGPTLLENGRISISLENEDFVRDAEPVTLTQDETLDRNLLPRLAVGLTESHDVVMAAIDGRNFDRALGLTLKETARLMKAMGCVAAMNLDGGSSKRMVLKGIILDLASTEIATHGAAFDGVRPVHSAILVHLP